MNIKFLFIASIAFLLNYRPVLGQSYRTAGGIRIDNGVHLSLQQFIANGWTAEGILHTAIGSSDLGLTVLAEKHHNVIFRNANFYTGAGFHYYGKNDAAFHEGVIKNVAGISAIAGLELSIGRLNVALDWKPELHLTGADHLLDWNGAAVSVRYIFLKRERKKVKDWKVWDKFEKKDKRRS